MALAFVLIMLALVFSIAAVSSRIATSGERAARSDRDRQVAFQAAEAALSDAELDIMHPASTRGCEFPDVFPEPGCGADSNQRGICTTDLAQPNEPLYKVVDFDEQEDTLRKYVRFGEFTGGVTRLESFQAKDLNNSDSAASTVGIPADAPKYIIERVTMANDLRGIVDATGQIVNIPAAQTRGAFVVTAIGYGYAKSTKVILQALIFKPSKSAQCT